MSKYITWMSLSLPLSNEAEATRSPLTPPSTEAHLPLHALQHENVAPLTPLHRTPERPVQAPVPTDSNAAKPRASKRTPIANTASWKEHTPAANPDGSRSLRSAKPSANRQRRFAQGPPPNHMDMGFRRPGARSASPPQFGTKSPTHDWLSPM